MLFGGEKFVFTEISGYKRYINIITL